MKYYILIVVVCMLLSTQSFADEKKSKTDLIQLDTINICYYDGKAFSIGSEKTIENRTFKCTYKIENKDIEIVEGAQWIKIRHEGMRMNGQ